jgi:hypothetical protein
VTTHSAGHVYLGLRFFSGAQDLALAVGLEHRPGDRAQRGTDDHAENQIVQRQAKDEAQCRSKTNERAHAHIALRSPVWRLWAFLGGTDVGRLW